MLCPLMMTFLCWSFGDASCKAPQVPKSAHPKLQLSSEEFVAIAKAINEAWEGNRK